MASRSDALKWELESETSSAMGPEAAAKRLWPILQVVDDILIRPVGESRMLAARQVRREPALNGIALQVLGRSYRRRECSSGYGTRRNAPDPATRYAPRFHAADFDGSSLNSPGVKYKPSQIAMLVRTLKGKGSWSETTA